MSTKRRFFTKSILAAISLGCVFISCVSSLKADSIYSIISSGIVPIDGRFMFYKTNRVTGETFSCQTGGKWKPVCRRMLAPIATNGPSDRFEAKFVPEVQATAIVVDNQDGTVWLCPSNSTSCEKQETTW
jgi:hypothetical protein